MNKRIVILVGVILLFSIIYVNSKYHYKEDHLYSERSLPEDQREENHQMITRRVAIQKAYEIFNLEYGVDLNESEIQMYVNLYKDSEKERAYRWVMSWYDYIRKENYTFTIDALDGQIIYLYAGKTAVQTANSNPQNLSYQEIMGMIQQFADYLGISMQNIRVEVGYPSKPEEKEYWQQKCKLIDEGTGETTSVVMIDTTNKIIREYELVEK